MSRDVTPYILKRTPDEAAPRALSIDYAAAFVSYSGDPKPE